MTTRRPIIRIGAIALFAAFAAALGAHAQAQTGLDASADAGPVDSADFQAGYPNETHQKGLITAALDADEATDAGDVLVVLDLPDDTPGLSFTADDDRCTAAGHTLTCAIPDVTAPWETSIPFRLNVTFDVEPQDLVAYDVSVQAEGQEAQHFPGVWEFMPPADDLPEFQAHVVGDYTGVEPGTAVHPTLMFESVDEYTWDDLLVTWSGQSPTLVNDYLETFAEYANCGTFGDDSETVCYLEDIGAAPGQVFALSPDTPVSSVVAESAPGPMTFTQMLSVRAIGSWNQDLIDGIDFFDTDTELVFEPVDGELLGDPWLQVTTAAHPFDLDARDDTVTASAGEEATIEIEVENHGPADALPYPVNIDLEEFVFAMAFQLPTGTEAPEGGDHGDFGSCRNMANSPDPDQYDRYDLGLDRIDVVCWGGEQVLVGDSFTFDLTVEVTSNTPANDGRAVVFDESTGTESSPSLDGDRANDIAVISLDRTAAPPADLPKTGLSFGAFGTAGALVIAAGTLLAVLGRRRTARP
ncbi:hypothetical protein AB0A73_03570 [Glycomyces sp. NPDC047369]